MLNRKKKRLYSGNIRGLHRGSGIAVRYYTVFELFRFFFCPTQRDPSFLTILYLQDPLRECETGTVIGPIQPKQESELNCAI